MSLPLSNVCVVELDECPSVAYAGSLLASLGASVRAVRNKESNQFSLAQKLVFDRSKVIEQATPATGDVPGDAIGDADIVLAASASERLESCVTASSSERPYVTVQIASPSLLGSSPATCAGGSLLAQARSGFASVMGEPGREPLSVPYDYALLQAGLHGACAAVAALLDIRSRRSGKHRVQVGAAETLTSYLLVTSQLYRFYGIPPRRDGRRAPGSGGRYPMTILPCLDGYVVMVGRSEQDWERYVQMIGNPRWASEDRYRDFRAMAIDYPEEVDAFFIDWLRDKTADFLSETARRLGLPMAVLKTPDESLRNEQFRHRGFFADAHGAEFHVEVPGAPWRLIGRRSVAESSSEE